MSLRNIFKNNLFIRGCYELFRSYLFIRKSKFGYIGNKVLIIPPIRITNPQNIFLYDNTKIVDATISTVNAKFIMKKQSAAAEGLSVHTGNHMMIVGKFYRTITEQDKSRSPIVLDQDIIVEEDAWIGCNVTLLAGAKVGRGSIVAAGAVVSKSVPPYSIVGGVPAKFIKFKWTIDEILKHEKELYPLEERISKNKLESIFEQYSIK